MSWARARSGGARETRVAPSGDVPGYLLRVSPRARHVRLTVTPHDGLVVVVPSTLRGFDPAEILRSKRAWIDESLARFADAAVAFSADPADLLPADVRFASTGESWAVAYRASESSHVTVRADDDALIVSGGVDDASACLVALNRWLQVCAKQRLLPLLASHAEKTGLQYRKAGVRGQRSRWGGCSAAGSITLNRCLLFLAPELVDAVVLHELAHLVHPNHSASFWRELERLDPLAREHRRAIRDGWAAVPAWAEPWVLRRL